MKVKELREHLKEQDKLDACRFCKSRNVNDTTPPPDMSDCEEPIYYWVCPDCVCCGPIKDTLQGATDAWNGIGL